MRHPTVLIPTPMPVTLSIAEVDEQFGVGSVMSLAVRNLSRPSRTCPGPCDGRTVNGTYGAWCGDCWRLNDRFRRLESAFYAVSECIRLVDAHSSALMAVDGSSSFTPDEWWKLATFSLARIFDETPELLPFQFDGGDS